MSVETVVGLTEQFAVEALFTAPGFVSCNQEDALALRIEGKGYSPLAVGRAEPQFIFAWREPFSVSTRGRPNCGPNCCSKRANARISVRTSWCSAKNSGLNSSPISTTQLNFYSMICISYDVKYISSNVPISGCWTKWQSLMCHNNPIRFGNSTQGRARPAGPRAPVAPLIK